MIHVKKIEEELDFHWCMDKIRPRTPYGIEYKKAMKPYPVGTDQELGKTLDILESYVDWLKNYETERKLDALLKHIKDIRFSIKRAEEEQVLSEVELFEIKTFIFLLNKIWEFKEEEELPEHFNTKIRPISELMNLLNPKGAQPDTFYIYDSYSKALATLRVKRSGKENEYRRAIRQLKVKIRDEYGIILSGDNTVITQKRDEAYRKKLEDCPYLIYSSETYNNLVFSLKLGEELMELQEMAEKLKEEEEEEEIKVRGLLSEKIAEYSKDLKSNIHGIANLDLYLAKARFALEINGEKPEIRSRQKIYIRNGRHPKIEQDLKRKSMKYIPITIELEQGVTCITGANMGGKTISLKLVGLLCLMAQMGLYVPADYMEFALQEYIVTSIGDKQSTESGLSTFGGEIANVVEAMKFADKKGLILIDELARGTNPMEGYAITLAIVEYLNKQEAITVLTTHFDRVTSNREIKHLQVIGLSKFDFSHHSINDVEDKLKILNKYMDYRLVEVSNFTEVPKDAINIAEIMGLPKDIVQSAEETVKNGW
ncbi:MAG: DNA mismatch repair protein MutS [Tissierellia bacterium]|nr:DNA mismatch repair protein MutS [Tissierellia bacterium]